MNVEERTVGGSGESRTCRPQTQHKRSRAVKITICDYPLATQRSQCIVPGVVGETGARRRADSCGGNQMVAKKTDGYRNYTADGSYWTVPKHAHTFWVLRLRSETYEQLEVLGGYSRAGAAAAGVFPGSERDDRESPQGLTSCSRQGRPRWIASQSPGIRL